MFLPEFGTGPAIKGKDHERSARQGGGKGAAWVQVKAAPDDDEQKHEQAENQRVPLEPFLRGHLLLASRQFGDRCCFGR